MLTNPHVDVDTSVHYWLLVFLSYSHILENVNYVCVEPEGSRVERWGISESLV